MNRTLAIALTLLSCLAGLVPVGVGEWVRTSEKPACAACDEVCPCCADELSTDRDNEPACPCRPARDSGESRPGTTVTALTLVRSIAMRAPSARVRERTGYAARVKPGVKTADWSHVSQAAQQRSRDLRTVERTLLCSWVV